MSSSQSPSTGLTTAQCANVNIIPYLEELPAQVGFRKSVQNGGTKANILWCKKRSGELFDDYEPEDFRVQKTLMMFTNPDSMIYTTVPFCVRVEDEFGFSKKACLLSILKQTQFLDKCGNSMVYKEEDNHTLFQDWTSRMDRREKTERGRTSVILIDDDINRCWELVTNPANVPPNEKFVLVLDFTRTPTPRVVEGKERPVQTFAFNRHFVFPAKDMIESDGYKADVEFWRNTACDKDGVPLSLAWRLVTMCQLASMATKIIVVSDSELDTNQKRDLRLFVLYASAYMADSVGRVEEQKRLPLVPDGRIPENSPNRKPDHRPVPMDDDSSDSSEEDDDSESKKKLKRKPKSTNSSNRKPDHRPVPMDDDSSDSSEEDDDPESEKKLKRKPKSKNTPNRKPEHRTTSLRQDTDVEMSTSQGDKPVATPGRDLTFSPSVAGSSTTTQNLFSDDDFKMDTEYQDHANPAASQVPTPGGNMIDVESVAGSSTTTQILFAEDDFLEPPQPQQHEYLLLHPGRPRPRFCKQFIDDIANSTGIVIVPRGDGQGTSSRRHGHAKSRHIDGSIVATPTTSTQKPKPPPVSGNPDDDGMFALRGQGLTASSCRSKSPSRRAAFGSSRGVSSRANVGAPVADPPKQPPTSTPPPASTASNATAPPPRTTSPSRARSVVSAFSFFAPPSKPAVPSSSSTATPSSTEPVQRQATTAPPTQTAVTGTAPQGPKEAAASVPRSNTSAATVGEESNPLLSFMATMNSFGRSAKQ